MSTTRSKTASLLAVLVVAGAVVVAFSGGAAALSAATITATDTAAGTDTDHTIETTTDSSATVKSVVVSYDASNVELLEKADITVEYNGTDQTVGSIEIVNQTAYEVTLDSTVSVASTGSLNVSTANEHVVNPYATGSEQVRVTTQDSNGNDLATTTASFTVSDAGADTVVVVSSRDDDLETESETFLGFTVPTVAGFGGQDYARMAAEDVPVNGSDANATITFAYADADAEDSLETAYEDEPDEAWTKTVLVTADGTPVVSFKDEAPDEDWLDTDEDTYGITNSSDNTVEIHLGDDYDDETEVGDVVVNANKGTFAQLDVYGLSLMTGPGGVMGFGALLGGALILLGRPALKR